MTDKIVIFSMASSAEEADKIAHALVEDRLAACVNVITGAHSTYRWKGAVQSSAEWLLIIKSSRELFDRVCTRLEQAHSYEVPEVVAIPVIDGSRNYLNWMEAELSG